MVKKLVTLLLALILCGCNSTIVYVTKTVYVIGVGNTINITGSELKDNQASQQADGKLEVPFIP